MQSVNGFFDMIKQFINGNGLYAIAGASYLLFIYQLKKKEQCIAIIAAVLLFIAVYNPLSYEIFGEKLKHTATYYRFLWMVPYVFLFAYFMYETLRNINNPKYRRALVYAVCIGILCINVKPEELYLPDNAYQIPTETIQVATQIETSMETRGEKRTVILCDFNIANTIRQYDASICLPFQVFGIGTLDTTLNEETIYGLMSMLINNRNDIRKDAIEKIVAEHEVTYLVIHKNNHISLSYMEEMDWQIISSTPTYHILRRQ